ncbi:tetratricopeptide repeat protein [uncultured Duncaniella sp.]|uniref:tetratricopeptide repeat protein n=1 Tax=uncultured Duncaniella sp. TaxID=2768039 RepID=UPI0025B6A519|nr:tetratricopeptide repeat protein [uncultured Duncaniella sp.]
MMYRIAIILFSLLLFFSCSDNKIDERLVHINEIIPESPEEALSHLDSINYKDLSEANQYFYDLVKIKAEDKAYIKHTSDSIILRVISYYATHDKDKLYTEALYYGGRIYRDMGDSPNALKYFHLALDNLTEREADNNLKARILSQTGRLLTGISLYDEAIPYIEESIKICELNKDTVNIVYELQLLGGTYLRAKKYRLAEHYFNNAIEMSSNLPVSFNAKAKMYLADVKYQTGQLDSALVLIRNTPDLVKPIARNSALAAASEIYLENELLDSAYIYAHELLNSSDSTNKRTAYQVMTSPKLKKLIPLDTLYQYISEYRELLENYHDDNKIQLAINQQNFYNYQQYVIKQKEAEAYNSTLLKWIFGISSLCLILGMAVFYYKNKVNKTLVELHLALESIDILNENIYQTNINSTTTEGNIPESVNDAPESTIKDDSEDTSFLTTKSEKELRDKLRNKLLSLYNSNKAAKLSEDVIESEAYKKLQELIKQKQILSYEDPFWDELEYVVIKSSPQFKENLKLLTQSRLTTIDLHTALLIKCHILPSQMAVLLSKSKGAIVSRRESLCVKIFGEQKGTKVIDGIIRLL